MTPRKPGVVSETLLSPDPETSPIVVAYRVGQLEKAVNDGFENIKQEMHGMINGFVSGKEFMEYKKEAETDNKQLWTAVDEFKRTFRFWITTGIGATAAIAGLIYTIATIARHGQ